MINVLVVDDRDLTHRLIETYLKPEAEIEIIGFAKNGQEAIEQISHLQPDVVLMDVEMPEMDGLSATKIITQKYSNIKVLILTIYDDEQHLIAALENGAIGYLLKTTTPQKLKNAICSADRGDFQLSKELTEKYLQKIVGSNPGSKEVSDLQEKVNFLDESLGKLEVSLEKDREINSGKNVERQIEEMLKKEMSILSDRDSHLQFKVDRMKYSQERLQQKFSYMFKLVLGIIGVNLFLFIYMYWFLE